MQQQKKNKYGTKATAFQFMILNKHATLYLHARSKKKTFERFPFSFTKLTGECGSLIRCDRSRKKTTAKRNKF